MTLHTQRKKTLPSFRSSVKLKSPFCVPAKVIKLVEFKNDGRVYPKNLITFACAQNSDIHPKPAI
jgi:hypothetical protein